MGEGNSITSSDDNDESDTEVLNAKWRVGGVTIDSRYVLGMTNSGRRPVLNLFGYQEASPAYYFLHFLPCDHIQQVVIPATNSYARSQRASWVDITWPEYLTFIMLHINMAIITCHSLESYWKHGTPESFDLPRVNFGKYMSMARFKD